MATVEQIQDELNYKVRQAKGIEKTITGGYTGDLLSDVMGNAEEGNVLITIQAHKNSVAVASLLGLPAIILCNGRTASDDMIEAAGEQSIALFETEDSQFTASIKLNSLLSK
ncbi:MAG: iron-sulfur binding hydrogenase [Sphaerochaetaceae bacterium]|nr:iron-sulfur binding hydrogenase [Sphaerochaetaceae bacterium]